MNVARVRAIALMSVLLIAALVLVYITLRKDNQQDTNYAASCPAGQVPVVIKPLPDVGQIDLKIYNGTKTPELASTTADNFRHHGFKVEKVGNKDNKPVTPGVAQIYFGPNTFAGAWVVRAYFLMTDPSEDRNMHFDVKNKSNIVTVILGTDFKQIGASTEVKQAIAALSQPVAPPGTCGVVKS
jgi:hypothetical protein